MSDNEDQAIREYMGRATSGIGDIKNLTWRFLAANSAIAAFVIWHKDTMKSEYIILLFSAAALAIVSVFIACHSFVKLKERRIELRETYMKFNFLDCIRPDYKNNVGAYDCGDWMFLASGVILPILLLDLVFLVVLRESFCWFQVNIWIDLLILFVSIFIGLLIMRETNRIAKWVEDERNELLNNYDPISRTRVPAPSCWKGLCVRLQKNRPWYAKMFFIGRMSSN